MKYLFTLSLLFFFATSTQSLQAQKKSKKKVANASFTVNGNCGMCKERIETAVSVKGVKASSWDFETQTLKVIYRPNKIEVETIQQLVADAGHDTELVKATDEAYGKLHACCNYRTNKSCEGGE